MADHHPEYIRAIRDAAAKCETYYNACFHVALGNFSEDWKQDAVKNGMGALICASHILRVIGEEPTIVAQEKARRAAEAAGG